MMFQEKHRAGTENVPSIVGIGKACEIAKMNIDEHKGSLHKIER